MKLGVCYYPEHWPASWWDEDARRMVELGVSWVRIAEFAWSRIEPEPGRFDWAWLDKAVQTLGDAGLQIVMCTPTATPPKWLVDRDTSMLAVDANGRPRKFGSRRHYCFSSEVYRAESARIVTALAERYGQHPAVGAWQTDNEYGCHNTTLSYSNSAAERFRGWCARRYNDVAALNTAWGNVFWSQEYRSFAEIDPPNLTVTEPNPSHRLAYHRFASDEVISFNKIQTDIIRRFSPGRDVTHNFMGFTTDFDHFEISRDLDFASWDSYPLGFLEQFGFPKDVKEAYLRQGHPDIAAFHHDLYRACGRGRWWVMEQQPGPVNWANHNPSPLPGMVRAWTWEAFAHGAEVVSYFRWRQVPFAQEQMHAGLNLPDRSLDVGGEEAKVVAKEIARIGPLEPCVKSEVALVYSFETAWMNGVQPQGRSFQWLRIVFEAYSALRALGLEVDFVPSGGDLTGYRLVVVPTLFHVDAEAAASLGKVRGKVLLGPRTGSKTRDLKISEGLPPGEISSLLPLKVTRVESLASESTLEVTLSGDRYIAGLWREMVRTTLIPLAHFSDGSGAYFRHGNVGYLATWPSGPLLAKILRDLAAAAGLHLTPPPEGVRISRRGGLIFAINYASEAREAPAPGDAVFVLGERNLPPAGVAAWRSPK